MPFVSATDSVEACRILCLTASPTITTDAWGRITRIEHVDPTAPGNKRGVIERTYPNAADHRLRGEFTEARFTEAV